MLLLLWRCPTADDDGGNIDTEHAEAVAVVEAGAQAWDKDDENDFLPSPY